MEKIWTRTEIVQLLSNNNVAVERAMTAIWNHQTSSEKSESNTKVNNGVGFSASTVNSGSYYAKWVNSGKRLSGKHLERARKIAIHHSGQLTLIANGKI